MLQLLRKTAGAFQYEIILSTEDFSKIKEKIREEIRDGEAPERLIIANNGDILCQILGDEVV